jgi:hypothetical protein
LQRDQLAGTKAGGKGELPEVPDLSVRVLKNSLDFGGRKPDAYLSPSAKARLPATSKPAIYQ